MKLTLGIEIGDTKLHLILGGGIIFQRRKLAVECGGRAEGIREQIAPTIPELITGRSIDTVGVGFGVLDCCNLFNTSVPLAQSHIDLFAK